MFGITLTGVLNLMTHYGYEIIFPIAVLEGPIISILSGLLISLGKLNFFIVFFILVVGDVIGDGAIYAFGRWGEHFVRKHGFRIGITEAKLEQTKIYFENNHKKALLVSKVAHGIGVTGLVVAGILKIPYFRFFRTCFVITFFQTLVLVLLGVFFGHAYMQIDKYLSDFAATITLIVLVVGSLLIFFKIKKSRKLIPLK